MKEEITVVEIIRAVKGKQDDLKKALEAIVPISRMAKGCLQYDLLGPLEKGPGEFLVLMRWENRDDLRRHESSSYIHDFVQKYENILYSDVSVTEWKKWH